MNAAAVLVGVATLVVADGVATSSEAAIQRAFDGLQPNRVTVAFADSTNFASAAQERLDRLRILEGVRAAGLTVDLSVPVEVSTSGHRGHMEVLGVGPGALEALGAELVEGFQPWQHESSAPVALVGRRAVASMGASAAPMGTLELDGRQYGVVGIIDDVDGRKELLDGIVIPAATALSVWGDQQTVQVGLMVESRAIDRLTRQIPLVVDPTAPSRVEVLAAPRPRAFEDEVDTQLERLLFGTGLAILVLAGFGIAASASAAAAERRSEIGVRRALGASRLDIAVQFALETVLIGVVAATVGAASAVMGLVVLAHRSGWQFDTDPSLALQAPFLGLLVGLLAGAWPARRASLVSPVRALTG